MKTLNCLKLVQRLPFLQQNSFYKFQSHPILQVKRALEAFKKNKDTSTPPEDKEDPEANVEFEINRLRKIREAIENDKSFEIAADKQKETFNLLNREDSPFNEKKFKEKDAEFTKFFDENISPFHEKPKIQRDFRNHELDVIKKFSIKKVEPKDQNSIRSGLLAYKVGMTGFWDKHGVYFPVTVLSVDRCQVLQVRETEDKKNVYLQLGIGEKSLKKTTKSLTGHFVKAGTPPKKDIRQFKVSKENALPVGYMLGVRHFLPGQLVDVQAVSKGRGTQGVMFKWGFSGGFKTHGASVSHRSAGSIGNREKPGRVFPGKKMAGHMGFENVTVNNLLIYRTDFKHSLIFVKGAVPGPYRGLVKIKDALRKRHLQHSKLHYPTFIYEDGVSYPDIETAPDTKDLNEVYQHDNDEVLGVSDEEEEGSDGGEEDEEGGVEVK